MKPKFRAWNSETKEIEVFNTYEEISELFLALSADDGFYSIMQSTGLKDKNDKEIFEGDILACKTDDEVINLNIFWDEEHALFMFESKKYNEQEPLAELVENNTYPFEIIGNIYENRELLEVIDEKRK